jgi:hypothetical protein
LTVLPGALGAGEAPPADKVDPRPSAHGSQTPRRDEIQRELADLKDHSWAGEYVRGDGLAENVRLALAPGTGFAVNVTGCGFIGWSETDFGAVSVTSGKLTLHSHTKPPDAPERSTEMHYVRWGERSYLVAADEVIEFCNQVNSGREPRNEWLGEVFLRVDDWKRKATGSPHLPPDQRRYLLKQPIRAEIAVVHSSTIDAAPAARRTNVTIGAGSKHGVFTGMDLYVVDPDVILVTARVTQADDETAEAIVEEFRIGDRAPAAGWKLSTRAPWHANETVDSEGAGAGKH